MFGFRNICCDFVRSSCASPAVSAMLLSAALVMTGCGSGTSTTTPPGDAPVIATQPASAVIPLGSAATLTVAATGTGPLRYQWSQNSSALSGANAATLTTAAVALTDSGDTFSVTISNAYGSVTSSNATITVGPRSPAQRDLRFKHVQMASNLVGSLITNVTAFLPGNSSAIQTTGDVGAPLMVGNQTCGTIDGTSSCGWVVYEFAAPAGIAGFNSSYGIDTLTDLSGNLASMGGNSVMTSLDEQTEPAVVSNIFAYSIETDPTVSNGYTLQRVQVTDSTLAATISAMAAKGVVITAASAASGGGIDLLGYAWTGDSNTVYDAQAVLTTYSSAGPQAFNLAQQGYIITAAGTADANQVLLVGTKVHGDTLPRNLTYISHLETGGTVTPSPGAIVVGNLFGNDAGNNPNLPPDQTLLAQ